MSFQWILLQAVTVVLTRLAHVDALIVGHGSGFGEMPKFACNVRRLFKHHQIWTKWVCAQMGVSMTYTWSILNHPTNDNLTILAAKPTNFGKPLHPSISWLRYQTDKCSITSSPNFMLYPQGNMAMRCPIEDTHHRSLPEHRRTEALGDRATSGKAAQEGPKEQVSSGFWVQDLQLPNMFWTLLGSGAPVPWKDPVRSPHKDRTGRSCLKGSEIWIEGILVCRNKQVCPQMVVYPMVYPPKVVVSPITNGKFLDA